MLDGLNVSHLSCEAIAACATVAAALNPRRRAVPGLWSRRAADVASEPMPDWLKRHLVTTGVMDVGGATDRAKPMHCRICRRTVIGGYDPYFATYCDPRLLSAHGELQASLHGLRTHELRNPNTPMRFELRPRTYSQWYELVAPTIDNDLVVLCQHQCQWTPPKDWQLHRPSPATDTSGFRDLRLEQRPDYVSLDNWIQFGF